MESPEAKLASSGGFVTEADSRIIGCAMHVVSNMDLIPRGLVVRPELEDRGIGTALVEAVGAKVQTRDLPRALLAVSTSNLEACDCYPRLGYVVNEEPYTRTASRRPAPVMFTKEL